MDTYSHYDQSAEYVLVTHSAREAVVAFARVSLATE